MRNQRVAFLCRHHNGFSLVGLMISMAIGLFISLAAVSLFLFSKNAYSAQDDIAEIQETGRYAMESIARALHQATYENWDAEDGPVIDSSGLSPSISGLDARSLKATTAALTSPITPAVNGSDILAIRFFGAGEGEEGDGTMLNCAGFSVPAVKAEMAEFDRGWSIFYVAKDSAGEPELRCKYKGKNSWKSDAIARGVESFQVLYGLDMNSDGLADQYVRATDINVLDEALVLTGSDDAAKALEKNAKSYWKKVVAVKVAFLIHGSHSARSDALVMQHDLFGKHYGDSFSGVDSGVRIAEADLPVKTRNRIRKIFRFTVHMRNQNSSI